MNSTDFYYDIDDEDKITKQIIYANATFNTEELFSNNNVDSKCLSVTIITPTQRVSVAFYRSHVPGGGHAGMVDVMLSKIYPNYTRAKSFDDQTIYSRNNENNIFILTFDLTILVFTPKGNKINQTQYDKLKQYMYEIKNSKYTKGNETVYFCENTFFSDYFCINELDKKMKVLEDNIVEIAIPKQYPIGELDFSGCESKNKIMEQVEKYVNEMKNQKKIYTQINNSEQAKEDFFGKRKLNTKLENEAREQVNRDRKKLDGHLNDRN